MSENDIKILEGARQTLTLMTAVRMADGMTADEAFKSALASFLDMCEQR